MAATAAGLLPTAATLGDFEWKAAGLAVLLSGAAVVLKGIAASQTGDKQSPNFREETPEAVTEQTHEDTVR